MFGNDRQCERKSYGTVLNKDEVKDRGGSDGEGRRMLAKTWTCVEPVRGAIRTVQRVGVRFDSVRVGSSVILACTQRRVVGSAYAG